MSDTQTYNTMATGFTMEKIVRPVHPIIQLRPDYPDQLGKPQPAERDNTVVWGSAGRSVFELRAASNGKAAEAKWPETDRKYDVVRVFNPDDRDQHIDTEVMTQFQGRNKISQDRIQIRFAETKATANTEVISRGNIRRVPGSN